MGRKRKKKERPNMLISLRIKGCWGRDKGEGGNRCEFSHSTSLEGKRKEKWREYSFIRFGVGENHHKGEKGEKDLVAE